MKRIISLFLLAFGLGGASVAHAVVLYWDVNGGGNWDTSTANWAGGATTYTDPNADSVNFTNNVGGTINIQGGGVTPLSVTVTNGSGTYTFTGGAINGSGGLIKSGGGTLQIGETYYGLDYTGNTQINGGVLRIDHNGGTTDHSLGGLTVLNGGTLRFNHTGAGHFNPVLTFTSGIQVNAAGGTIDFSGGANSFNNTISAPTLGGDLTVTGVTGQPNFNGASFNFTSGSLVLTANAKITNATTKPNADPAKQPHTIYLSPTMSGSAYTLTLATTGTGGGFEIDAATATSLDLGGLIVGAGSNLALRNDGNTSAYDVLDKIKANGGVTTVYGTLSLGGYAFTRAFKTANVSFQPGSQLNLMPIGGTWDSNWSVTGNLTVDSAGLTTLYYQPYRGGMTLNAANTLTVGNGGTFSIGVYRNDGAEYTSANLKFLNGATIVGANGNSFYGGLIRSGGVLTLGNGSASVITILGNHGTQVDTFNLGYAANTVDNGNVTMKYANTTAGAGNYFNVGWSNGGALNAALQPLMQTSGGTQFAPLAGSGGVAVVGPNSGNVVAFTKPVTLTTAGTVGFYNYTGNNTRGALGSVLVSNTTFSLTAAGTVKASSITFTNGATLSGIGTVLAPVALDLGSTIAPGNSPGTLTMSSLTMADGTTYAYEAQDLVDVNGALTLPEVAWDISLDGAVGRGLQAGGWLTLFTFDSFLNPSTYQDMPTFTYLNFTGPGAAYLSVQGNSIILNGVSIIPEPSTLWLFGCGGLALFWRRRK